MDTKVKKQRDTKNFWKTVRLIQVTGLILATLLLSRQDFAYSWVMAGFVALTASERLFNLIYRA